MAVIVSDQLRNLTYNGSTHCTQVSESGPLGLLLIVFITLDNDIMYFHSQIVPYLQNRKATDKLHEAQEVYRKACHMRA